MGSLHVKLWTVLLIVLVFSLCLSDEKPQESMIGEKEPKTTVPIPTTTIAPATSAQEKAAQTTPIAKARDLLGETVTVKGVVTAPPGVFREDVMYIQDDTAGIKIYSEVLADCEIRLGNVVCVEGVVDRFYGNIEVKFIKKDKISVLEDKNPHPLPLSIKKAKKMEGSFVTVKGTAANIQHNKFYLQDDTEKIAVYIDRDTGITLDIEKNEKIRVSGIITQYKGQMEILPRYDDDITLRE